MARNPASAASSQCVGVETDRVELASGTRRRDQIGQVRMQRRLADALQDDRVGRWRIGQDGGEAPHRHVGVAPGTRCHA
jgi:hypothetical protein